MTDIKLWNKAPLYDGELCDQPEPFIRPFLVEKSDVARPCILIYPGGGYLNRADEKEGRLVAERFNAAGVSAFVVGYRCVPYYYPAPYLDAQRAIRYVRYNSEKFGIDPNKIGVMGFSAGGHLASMVSVHYDACKEPVDDIDLVSARPDFTILGYSVTTSDPAISTQRSHKHLMGDERFFNDPELLEYLSVEKYVTSECPPAFIWATATDKTVNCENSIVMARAYWEKGVSCALHIFEVGGHGLGLADGVYRENLNFPTVKQWADLCEEWLKSLFK